MDYKVWKKAFVLGFSVLGLSLAVCPERTYASDAVIMETVEAKQSAAGIAVAARTETEDAGEEPGVVTMADGEIGKVTKADLEALTSEVISAGTTSKVTAAAAQTAASAAAGSVTSKMAEAAAETAAAVKETAEKEAAEKEAAAREAAMHMGESVVSYAMQFVGNPYVYGGTSLTNGTDCSGFVMSVYAHFGYSLPHSSRSQSGYGTAVSLDSLQPGDLIFFAYGGGISHVAMYAGNGNIVHASSPSTGICVQSLASQSGIVCARRILN